LRNLLGEDQELPKENLNPFLETKLQKLASREYSKKKKNDGDHNDFILFLGRRRKGKDGRNQSDENG